MDYIPTTAGRKGWATIVKSGLIDVYRGAAGDFQAQIAEPEKEFAPQVVQTRATIKTLSDYESHFKWISTYLLDIDQLKRLRWKLEAWKEETQEADKSYLHNMSKYLEQLVLDFILENKVGYEEAVTFLDMALEDFPPDMPSEQYTAYNYLVLIEKSNIMERTGDLTAMNNFLKTIGQMDITHNKSEAIILAIKAIFIGLLGHTDERLNLLRQAVELDPVDSGLHQSLYSTLRRTRRERDFTSTPADEEIRACRRAFELDPKSSGALTRMSVLYNEIIKANRSGQPNKLIDEKGIDEITREMIWFARKACDLNPNCLEVNVRLAELLAYSGAQNGFQDLERSKEQFEHCLREWPNSSHVLHKVGKFYMKAAHNLKMGMDSYKKALEADAENYPCLMDYLRELYRQSFRKSDDRLNHALYNDLVEILDLEISVLQYKKVLCARLKSIKAALLWKLSDAEQAIYLWLDAITQDPDCIEDDIMTVMSGSNVFGRLLKHQDFEEIMNHLYQRRNAFQVETDEVKTIDVLISALKRDMEDWRLFQREKSNNPNWRQSNLKDRVPIFNRRQRYLSECDIDCDWRSGCFSSSFSDSSSMMSGSSYASNVYEYSTQNSQYGYSSGNENIGQLNWQESRYGQESQSVDREYGHRHTQLERTRFGSTMSISSVGSRVSWSSMESAFSQSYGFQRPYNRKQYKSQCDTDDNWRRK